MTIMTMSGVRAVACLALLTGAVLLGGCSSSFGGGGSAPQRTYVILPNGTAAPVQTQQNN